MCLLRGHDLIDNNILTIGIVEYRVPVRHMHAVTLFFHIQPLDVTVCMRMVSEAIDMFSYDTTILLWKGCKKFYCSFGDLYLQTITSCNAKILLRPVPRDGLFVCVYFIEIGDELFSLVLGNKFRDRIVKCLARFSKS